MQKGIILFSPGLMTFRYFPSPYGLVSNPAALQFLYYQNTYSQSHQTFICLLKELSKKTQIQAIPNCRYISRKAINDFLSESRQVFRFVFTFLLQECSTSSINLSGNTQFIILTTPSATTVITCLPPSYFSISPYTQYTPFGSLPKNSEVCCCCPIPAVSSALQATNSYCSLQTSNLLKPFPCMKESWRVRSESYSSYSLQEEDLLLVYSKVMLQLGWQRQTQTVVMCLKNQGFEVRMVQFFWEIRRRRVQCFVIRQSRGGVWVWQQQIQLSGRLSRSFSIYQLSKPTLQTTYGTRIKVLKISGRVFGRFQQQPQSFAIAFSSRGTRQSSSLD